MLSRSSPPTAKKRVRASCWEHSRAIAANSSAPLVRVIRETIVTTIASSAMPSSVRTRLRSAFVKLCGSKALVSTPEPSTTMVLPRCAMPLASNWRSSS